MAPSPFQLLSLSTLLLWAGAAPAQAQIQLRVSAETGGGYDSNIYYEGGAFPDALEVDGGGFIGVLPDATLVVGPLADHYLMLSYQGDFRQFINSELDNETALSQWIMLGYQPPPVLGVRLLLAGGLTQLYFRALPEGGWLGAVGMAQLRRNIGSDALEMGLTYSANYTSYSAEVSASWTLSHTTQLWGAWRPGHGIKVSPYYAFTYADADPEKLAYMGHTAGATLAWTLPWAPVTVEVGYDFIALQLQSETTDSLGSSTSVLVDRTDLQHQGRARARVNILPWLQAFASWESLWGESDSTLVEDYSRHQALGGLVLRWGQGEERTPGTALATAATTRPGADHHISLVFKDPEARAVSLVGTFNDWDPERHPMAREGGKWRVTVAPPPGVHQFMIWVDGDVRPPPACGRWINDGFGGKNCVMLIGVKE